MDWSRLFNIFFSLIYAFFTGIAAMSFSLFKCQSNPNGKDTLTRDLSVICHDDDWNSMVGVGIVAIVIYCGGCIALFGSVIYEAPGSFNDTGFQKRWKFLFIKYRLDVYWWGIVFLMKGVILNMGPVFFTRAPAQLYWMMATCMVYLGLMAQFFPWRVHLASILDIVVHLSVILIISLLTYFGDADDELRDGLSAFTVLVSCLPFLFYAVSVTGILYPSMTGRNVGTTVAVIKKSMSTLGALDEGDISAIFKGLSQHDQ